MVVGNVVNIYFENNELDETDIQITHRPTDTGDSWEGINVKTCKEILWMHYSKMVKVEPILDK